MKKIKTKMPMYKQINDDTLILSQQAIYGSSRLGVLERDEIVSIDSSLHPQMPTIPDPLTENVTHWIRGKKRYELTNHLGNVLATVNDRKLPIYANNNFNYYKAEVMTANDYYAFGMVEPKRGFDTSDYRFGFGSHEKDDEIYKANEWYTFGDYGYDPRIVQRPRTEPLTAKYPQLSPYVVFGDNPILLIDTKGEDPKVAIIMNRDANDFNEHIKGLQNAGFTVVQVKDGQQLISELKKHSPVNDPIDQLVILSHSMSYGLIGNDASENGLYTSEGINMTSQSKYGDFPINSDDPIMKIGKEIYNKELITNLKVKNRAASTDDIKSAVSNKEINFSDNAQIILGGCNSVLLNDKGEEINGVESISRSVSDATQKTVIGSSSETSPVKNQPSRTGMWNKLTPGGGVLGINGKSIDMTKKQK